MSPAAELQALRVEMALLRHRLGSAEARLSRLAAVEDSLESVLRGCHRPAPETVETGS
jgi:hypothetical protein